MPTDAAWYDYAIRLDAKDPAKLVEFLEKDGGAFYVVRELEDSNPHFHAYVHSKRKLPAFRSAFVRACLEGSHGNGAYSITAVRDIPKYHRYCSKGASAAEEPSVVQYSGIEFNAEWFSERHAEYWAVNEELMAQRRSMPVWEAVLQACRTAGTAWSDKRAIALIYLRELAARDKAINIFSVRSSVALISVKLCPDDSALEDLATSVAAF